MNPPIPPGDKHEKSVEWWAIRERLVDGGTLRARVELGQNGGEPQGSARDRRGLPLEDLFEAIENTALLEGSREEFLEAWDALKGLAASGEIQVDPG
jgi:hypothetical protein